LSFVVKDEVLKITSDRMRSEDVYTVTYPVGDLVIPIPNFTPSNKMGLSGALADAQAALMNAGGGLGLASHAPISVMANSGLGGPNASVLGQVNVPFMSGGGGGPPVSGTPQNIGFGPGGMGGGVQPDFDSLIELITSTIRQQDWQDNGGTIGFIKSHDTTLSLVITHDVRGHEEIENLLTQLRKLQDLQVTIEVRFITLSDAFYEQVGVDFDLDIDDDTDVPFQVFGKPNPAATPSFANLTVKPNNISDPGRDIQDRDHGPTATVGMSAPGVFSTDLDIPFSQTSLQQVGGAITTAIPGATGAGGASVGFAILSDLEAFFFMTAVQDDQRSNILQAPKVTMFNGQTAFVSDTEQRPFVVSVVPVVGDFAAAQQPVIVVLNEGTSLSVQAVVSNDRRFVRMTMVPFFSQIGDVNTFTFEGSESSTRTSSSATQGPGEEEEAEEETTSRTGTTVQLPVFAFQTVSTTVSVPDGGTVLLGGIKTMREARNENGVPLLSKIPYVNRLFTNVAVGKRSTSLMMMVTPRIIIQEEEEAAIGILAAP
jgi:general secretion pathway protein D